MKQAKFLRIENFFCSSYDIKTLKICFSIQQFQSSKGTECC